MWKSIILILFLCITTVAAVHTNSSTYNMVIVDHSSGGTNSTSANYYERTVAGTISQNITSTSYNNMIGFWVEIENIAPFVRYVNVGPEFPIQFDNLTCTFLVYDFESNQTLTNYTWFKNGTFFSQGQIVTDRNTEYTVTLDYNNTDINDTWNCTVFSYDGEDFSLNHTDSVGIFANLAPVVTLDEPGDNYITTNRSIFFNWSGYDAEGENLTYDLEIICHPACSDDNRIFYGINQTNYTADEANLFNYLYDGDANVSNYWYEWRVRAFDGLNIGDWTSNDTFWINSLVQLDPNPSSIYFNNLTPGSNYTYLGNESITFVNNGNIYLNVSLNNSNYLFNTITNESSNYRFRVREAETNSTGNSTITTWTNFTLGVKNIINGFDFRTYQNEVYMDLFFNIPRAEPAGNKTSDFTIIYEIEKW